MTNDPANPVTDHLTARTHLMSLSSLPDASSIGPAAVPAFYSHALQAQEVADAQPASAPAYVDGRSGSFSQAYRAGQDFEPSRLRHSARSPPLTLVYGSPCLEQLPNEILLHVLGFLDVSDLLSTSRTNHLLRSLSLAPVLHHYRLRLYRHLLPPLLFSPSRPSIPELASRSIFLTHTSVISRRLARSLVSIRLSHRLATRPSPEALVHRAVLPPECVPGLAAVHVAPGLVAKRKAIEKEKLKDGLRTWMAGKWRREMKQRQEKIKIADESRGVGRVWRLTRFWERMSRGESYGGLAAW